MPPPYCYEYPRPSVTVDLAVFAIRDEALQILLVRRKHDPFAGAWALPGGFLEMDEEIEAGARRELREETGFDATGPLEFLGVYGKPGRDPRGRTISLFHAAVIPGDPPDVGGHDDAEEAAWRLAFGLESLAFDHDAMVRRALDWVGEGVRSGRIGLDFLPGVFRKDDAATLFRATLGSASGVARWLVEKERGGLIEKDAGTEGGYRRVAPDKPQ